MERINNNAASAALKESIAILELMEHLLIGSDGRSHLASMRFGGVRRLARRITMFLNHGSIHRDESGAECCAKFLREVYDCSCIEKNENLLKNETSKKNTQQNLIHPEIYTTEDIQQWLTHHIVEATLHQALKLLTTTLDTLHSNLLITKNYESNSFIRQEKATYRLVEGSRPFDDQDSSRLAEIALFGSEVYKMPTYSDLMTEQLVQKYADPSNTNVPETNVIKEIPKRNPHRVVNEKDVMRSESNKSISNLNHVNHIKGKNNKRLEPQSSHPMLSTSVRNEQNRAAEDPMSSSCPGLTSVAVQRYLGSRNWNSESLRDDDELENIKTHSLSKSLGSMSILSNIHHSMSDFRNKELFDEQSSSDEKVQNSKETGAKPKIKSQILPNSVDMSTKRRKNHYLSCTINSASTLKPLFARYKSHDAAKQERQNFNDEKSNHDIQGYSDSTDISKASLSNRIETTLSTNITSSGHNSKRISHRRTQSDTMWLKLATEQNHDPHQEEQKISRLFPMQLRKIGSNNQVGTNGGEIFAGNRISTNTKMDQINFPSDRFSSRSNGSIPYTIGGGLIHNSSLLDYIHSGEFSRQISSDLQNGHLSRGSQVLMADNAHLILAEALIQSGLSLINDYCKGEGEDNKKTSVASRINQTESSDLNEKIAANPNKDAKICDNISKQSCDNNGFNENRSGNSEYNRSEENESCLTKFNRNKSLKNESSDMDAKILRGSGFTQEISKDRNDLKKGKGTQPNQTKHVGMLSSTPTFYTVECDIKERSEAEGSLFRKHSAEATALDLLYSLKDPHSLKASDLALLISKSQKPLVSEEDAPQKLLPLPNNTSGFSGYDPVKDDQSILSDQPLSRSSVAETVNFSETSDEYISTFSNDGSIGTDDTEAENSKNWAPPTQQLILECYQKPRKAKDGLRLQNYMCHDCGMRPSSPSLAIKGGFRFCFYFGKYSCTSCHSNQTHVLPSAIIHNWDFKEYSVSNFAHTVLSRFSIDPLFVIEELNPALIQKVPKLKKALELRRQATEMAKYLASCRIAGETMKEEDYKDCIMEDYRKLSLIELCLIRLGAYGKSLKNQLKAGIEHTMGKATNAQEDNYIGNCPLCYARGFICESCRSEDVIFPFQSSSEVYQCKTCYACYHGKCYLDLQKNKSLIGNPCIKCRRIEKRQAKKLEVPDEFTEEEN